VVCLSSFVLLPFLPVALQVNQTAKMGDKDWRCQKYGPLGIMETIIKLIGTGAGMASLSIYSNDDENIEWDAGRISTVVLTGVILLLFLVITIQRFLEHELIAIVFAILQLLGCLTFFIVTVKAMDPDEFAFVYAFLYLLGTCVKLASVFIEKEDYQDMALFPWVGIMAVEILLFILFLVLAAISMVLLTTDY
jgi:hypothetical protein